MLPANPTSQSLWGPQCPRALTAVAEEAGGGARGREGRPTFLYLHSSLKGLIFPVSWVFFVCLWSFSWYFFKRQDIFRLTAPSAWTDVSKDAETHTFTPSDTDSPRPGPAEFSALLPALQNHRIKVVTNLIFLDFSSPTSQNAPDRGHFFVSLMF